MSTYTKAIPTIEDYQRERQLRRFEDVENTFAEFESNISALRGFIVKHHDTIAPFYWHVTTYDKHVEFHCASGINNPKEIARAFGAEGWKREPDRHTCGSINWKKEVDGIALIIKGAETIKPTLKEEVRL